MAGQRNPSGDCGTWQSGGFLERQVIRHVNERLLVQHRVFRQHAVEIGAEPVGQIVGLDRAAEPAQMEATGNPVAILTRLTPSPMAATSPAPSEGGMTPSLVGPRPPAFENHQISVVERARSSSRSSAAVSSSVRSRFMTWTDTRTIFVFRCPTTQKIYHVGYDPAP
jgi:hypothetical protein